MSIENNQTFYCTSCQQFLSAASEICPHCGSQNCIVSTQSLIDNPNLVDEFLSKTAKQDSIKNSHAYIPPSPPVRASKPDKRIGTINNNNPDTAAPSKKQFHLNTPIIISIAIVVAVICFAIYAGWNFNLGTFLIIQFCAGNQVGAIIALILNKIFNKIGAYEWLPLGLAIVIPVCIYVSGLN